MNKLLEKSFLFWSIKEYAMDICDFLQIELPNIKIVSNKSTMATYYPHNDTIEISDTYDTDYDYAFAIAHELRHKWQIKHKHFKLSEYIEFNDRNNEEEYHMQAVEIDANAFSFAINFVYLEVEPTTIKYSSNVMSVLLPKVKTMIKETFNERVPRFEKTILN